MQTLQRLAVATAITILLVTVAGCSMAGASPGLADRVFLSVSVTDRGVARPLVAGTRIRLDVRATDIGASAGCNSISGTYRLEGGRLVFEGGAMTEIGCDADRMSQDDWLIALLGSKPAVRLSGNELTLESDTIVVRLLDRKVAEPDAALTGHAWTVVSVIAGDTVSSVPAGAVATVTFNVDGTMSVNAGCNQGGAAWKAAGTGIEVSALVLTKKACEGAGGQLESAVVGVLRAGSIAASIDADMLTLLAGGGGLQLRAS
ncbi:MAG: META domain-containing protein [Chloroflexota bacterium]